MNIIDKIYVINWILLLSAIFADIFILNNALEEDPLINKSLEVWTNILAILFPVELIYIIIR